MNLSRESWLKRIKRWILRISVRRILWFVSLLFLMLPIGGIYFLRLYETTLIQQTESELISQAAFVAAIYKQNIAQALARNDQTLADYGLPLSHNAGGVQFIQPHLDLAQEIIYAPRPVPVKAQMPLDSISVSAGQALQVVLADTQKITLSGIKVLNYNGFVVSGKEEYGLSFAHAEEFLRARHGEFVSLLRHRRMPKSPAALDSMSRNSSINVFVALPIVWNERFIGVVWLNRTPNDIWQTLYNKRIPLLWTTLLLILFAFLMSVLTSLTITRPIRQLVQKTRLISENDPAGLVRLAHPITSEMAELADSVASMARTIQTRTTYIRDFTTHVSHEFKTPLTAIQGGIELLQDHLETMPREQQRKFLNNLAEDSERLKRLVMRLLELAKADMSEASRQTTSLLPLLATLTERFQPLGLSIEVHQPETPEGLTIWINQETLATVLGSLLENSLQADASQVEISLALRDTTALLLLQDNGPGISTANQSEIFTPFFTTKRATGGTGLGLSITQSLLTRQGGTIRYVPSQSGACFQLELPLV
jgi:signal transduction histidine kinase